MLSRRVKAIGVLTWIGIFISIAGFSESLQRGAISKGSIAALPEIVDIFKTTSIIDGPNLDPERRSFIENEINRRQKQSSEFKETLIRVMGQDVIAYKMASLLFFLCLCVFSSMAFLVVRLAASSDTSKNK